MMDGSCSVTVDPRIRRTRLLLQEALGNLLTHKEFDQISVHDIAEAATVNRATFYDHYPDKFALLECMVGQRFADLLAARGVTFDGGCGFALRAMALGVCDYLAAMPRLECEQRFSALEKMISDLKTTVEANSNKDEGKNLGFLKVVTGISLLANLVLITYYFSKVH